MAGSSIRDDCNLPALPNRARTILLVGRSGNGKSATCNSIMGRVFGFHRTTEMQSTTLKDGQVINVIDTVGVCDPFFYDGGFIVKALVKVIEMAKDGIHAIVLVFSIRIRFTEEEAKSLVFTGGEELEEDNETFDDYLSRGCPEQLQHRSFLKLVKIGMFNNKTRDGVIKANQTQQLLDYIEIIMKETGGHGRPYTDNVFKELEKEERKLSELQKHFDSLEGYSAQEISDLKELMHKSHEDQKRKRITQMVELKLREPIKLLENQLALKRVPSLKAEMLARAAQGESNKVIGELIKELEKALKDNVKLRKEAAKSTGTCLFS